jgi:MFS-type transporter involved in bile tolerance (Atg22 family)
MMGCRNFWLFDSKEHFGWLVCYVFSGVWAAYFLMVFNTQILIIAELAADADGNLAQFFEIRWSNAIALPASVGAFSMLIAGPLIGSIADYTPHRKLFGAIAVVATILSNSLQMFVNDEILGIVLAMTILGNISYLSVYMLYRAPYLPELAVGPEVAKLSAKGYLILLLTQVFFMGFFTTLGTVVYGSSAEDAQPYIYMRSGCAAAVLITIILAVIVIKYIGHRDASNKLLPSESIYTVGFTSVYNAFKEMSKDYTQLRTFLIFSSFANASFNAALALGTTYMIGIGLTTLEINAALGCAVIVGLCGPLIVTYLMNSGMSIRKIMLITVILFFIIVMLIPVLTPVHFAFLLILGAGLGISLGMWLSCGQAFFAELCPGGKEATFTGCYMFANKVWDWMPPLIFSIVNQVTGDITAAYYSAMTLFTILAIFICYTINMEKGEDEIKHTLSDRRLTVRNLHVAAAVIKGDNEKQAEEVKNIETSSVPKIDENK